MACLYYSIRGLRARLYNHDMVKVFSVSCSAYDFKGGLDLTKVSRSIDEVLLAHFKNRSVVLRGIQSQNHPDLSKTELISFIRKTGSDRLNTTTEREATVSDKPIDFFGYECVIKKQPIVLPVLEGFHIYKPKSLEKPQKQVDIWMVYDADQLQNVEYLHGRYGVKAKDGYLFKNPKDKPAALLGILVIDTSAK